MSRVLLVLVLPLAIAMAFTGCARPAVRINNALDLSPTFEAQIDAIGQRTVDEQGIVGLSIAVAKRGHIVYARGFGHADATRTISTSADTIYDIASVGKQFTAAAIIQLVEQGKLSYDTRVKSLVPELPELFPDATVEQLLRHTSGFVSGDFDELDPPADCTTPRYGLELLTDTALQEGRTLFAAGETWVYSNSGYLALGLVVEAASGERYDDYIRNHVLAPLTPHDLLVCEYAPPPRGSRGLRRTADGPGGVAPVPFIHMSAYGGQGSICSSAIDLLRWSIALNEGRIFSRESLVVFRTPSTVRGTHAAASIPYGMGQRLGVMDGHTKAGHSGTFDGGSAALFTYPGAGLDVVVISNTRGHGTPHAVSIEAEIAKLLLGVEPPDVESERTPVSETQKRAIEGTYTDGKRLTARIEGDELVELEDGKEVGRLVHIGDMRFRRPDKPDVYEWFVMDGEHAGWWIYTVSGNFLDVMRREDPVRGPDR